MNDLKSMVGHLNHWNDTKSIVALAVSDKSNKWHEAEINNHLTAAALMFQYSPPAQIIQKWAYELSIAGYKENIVKDVCKSIPYKFEKFPTFSQITELLRPYLAKESTSVDELDDLTHKHYFDLKKKFISVSSEEIFEKMMAFYRERFPYLKIYSPYFSEVSMLNNWARCYFGDGAKIIAQAEKTNIELDARNRSYLLDTLRKLNEKIAVK